MADRVPCYGHVQTLVYIDLDGAILPDADIHPPADGWTFGPTATRRTSSLGTHVIAN